MAGQKTTIPEVHEALVPADKNLLSQFHIT